MVSAWIPPIERNSQIKSRFTFEFKGKLLCLVRVKKHCWVWFGLQKDFWGNLSVVLRINVNKSGVEWVLGHIGGGLLLRKAIRVKNVGNLFSTGFCLLKPKNQIIGMLALQTPQSANLHLQIIWVHAKDVINESEKELTILKLLQFQLSSIISPLVSRMWSRARKKKPVIQWVFKWYPKMRGGQWKRSVAIDSAVARVNNVDSKHEIEFAN